MLGPAFFLSGDTFPDDSYIESALRARLASTLPDLIGQTEILARAGEARFRTDIARRLELLDRLVPAGEAGKHVVLMGRSSGARVVSLFAAQRNVAAVICLGYPFRYPNRVLEPDRFAHLARIAVPTLIVQAIDDPYGGIDVTEHYALSPSVSLKFVSGKHGLHVQPSEWDAIAQSIVAFCDNALHGLPADSLPFDEAFYLQAYPDIAQAVATSVLASGEEHYRKYGRREGRRFRFLPSGVIPAADSANSRPPPPPTPSLKGRGS